MPSFLVGSIFDSSRRALNHRTPNESFLLQRVPIFWHGTKSSISCATSWCLTCNEQKVCKIVIPILILRVIYDICNKSMIVQFIFVHTFKRNLTDACKKKDIWIEPQMDLFSTRVPDGSFYFVTRNWTNYHNLCINQMSKMISIMYLTIGYKNEGLHGQNSASMYIVFCPSPGWISQKTNKNRINTYTGSSQ